jgi:hypothetical protein
MLSVRFTTPKDDFRHPYQRRRAVIRDNTVAKR